MAEAPPEDIENGPIAGHIKNHPCAKAKSDNVYIGETPNAKPIDKDGDRVAGPPQHNPQIPNGAKKTPILPNPRKQLAHLSRSPGMFLTHDVLATIDKLPGPL